MPAQRKFIVLLQFSSRPAAAEISSSSPKLFSPHDPAIPNNNSTHPTTIHISQLTNNSPTNLNILYYYVLITLAPNSLTPHNHCLFCILPSTEIRCFLEITYAENRKETESSGGISCYFKETGTNGQYDY